MYIYLKFYILILSFIYLTSCATGRYTGYSNNIIETFYTGDAGTQYFIKPINIKGEIGNYLNFDLTFRVKNEIKDSATFNFSIFTNQSITEVDSLHWASSENHFSTNQINLMFVERSKKLFKCRFTCKIPLTTIRNFFRKADFKITAFSKNSQFPFILNSASKKKISYVNYNVFNVFK